MYSTCISHSIVIFDGECNFCNSSITRIIENDPNSYFVFAPFQSIKAKELLSARSFTNTSNESIILIEEDKIYIKSTAVLRIAKQLSGFYPFLFLFIIFPLFLRDSIYDFVARNRFKWFGKRGKCMIPSPEVQNRFIS